MFTGIVEERGEVTSLEQLDRAARITIRAPLVTTDIALGDSVAVNGVCLTATAVGKGIFSADVMAETLGRSALGQLSVGSPVNLERAMTASTRFGGHIVQGHVDGVGVIESRESTPHWEDVSISAPSELRRYIVEKGSITVDGISLTVARVDPSGFVVSLIPTTLAVTTMGSKKVADTVNLEVDIIAKYVERLVGEYGMREVNQ